jgi:allophanate hydrolase
MFPTIGALRAAYARGVMPAAVLAETYRRIEAAADPGTTSRPTPQSTRATQVDPCWIVLVTS